MVMGAVMLGGLITGLYMSLEKNELYVCDREVS
jgi:hypothetical protein